jgi:hypothetical protein
VELNKSDDADQAAALRYAQCVEIGTTLSFIVIALELAAYLSGALSPQVPLQDLPRLWGLPLKDYLVAAQVPPGWGWLALVGAGDYQNFIGITLLASISMAAYFCALRAYIAQRERIYAALTLAQLCITLAAATGLLNWIERG